MEKGRMNITEHESGTMRLFAARTGAKDMVVIRGSVLGGHYMLDRRQRMVPRIAAELLDAGTRSRSKDSIRSALTSRGASIHFSPGGDRTHFSASCLPEDTDFVLTLIAECLAESIFPATEVSMQKKRTAAELNELKTNTAALAARTLMRTIYDRAHVNYSETIAESIAHTQDSNRADMLEYQKLLGKGGLVLAITGDVVPARILAKAERAFRSLPRGTEHESQKRASTVQPKASESLIHIPDKANVDVLLGARVPITSESPEYLPFKVVTSLLGASGLSNGHLMRTIRERDGLTYGIYANPVGFSKGTDGLIQISATFSPATYEKAIQATKKEISVFLAFGINEKALRAKKAELTGRYAIRLGTSAGLAGKLHSIGIKGQALSYIDEYPSLINALHIRDLKKVATLIPFDRLAIVAAGTFDKKR